jgi:hypothetical protein
MSELPPPPPFATPLPPGPPVNEAASPPIPPPPPQMAPPPPMASFAYAAPRSGRPGGITAIGVTSIVVGCLSFFGYIIVGFSLIWFSFMARFAGFATAAPPAPPTVVAPAATTQPSGGGSTGEVDGATLTVDPADAAPVEPAEAATPIATPKADALEVEARGLNPEARANVVEALSNAQFITEPRLAQLEGLLAKSGKDMFPNPGGKPLTSERVTGMLEGVSVGLSGDPNVPGPDTFRTPGGRVELYDERGVFYPVRNAEIVRVSRPTAPTGVALTEAEVKTVIDSAQSQLGNSMNPAQVAGLRTILTTPGQKHVSRLTLPTAVRSASQVGDSVYIEFPNSTVMIAAQGQTTVAMQPGGSAGAGMGFAGRAVKINGVAMALAVVGAVAGLGLAIYLFVIGVMVLRESPRGRRLHQVYACLALVVIVAGTTAAWWLSSDFTTALNSGSSASANPIASNVMSKIVSTAILGPHLVVGVLGCVYPMVLLITLQTARVKEYYRSSVA